MTWRHLPQCGTWCSWKRNLAFTGVRDLPGPTGPTPGRKLWGSRSLSKTILVVDDDPTQRRLIQAVLEREGFVAGVLPSGDALLERLDSGGVCDLILLDLVMPGRSGLETLGDLRVRGHQHPVIVLTASGGIDTVVSAMQAGATDFFVKPASPERITISINNALSIGALKSEVAQLRKRAEGKTTFSDLVGDSPAMQIVRRMGERAARSSIPVLITGESGVGKEVIARAVHGSSDRAGRPFVAVNCGAIPGALVESLLFGHEKGSFTGATEKHAGKFQEANGGTLLLDEVGELPMDVQVKLLRVLQEGEIDPVGSRRSRKVDVRIISATNRDLSRAVAEGGFREDLFYRLNVFPIEAPPLRERREDIPALVESFIRRISLEEGRTVTGATPETLELLVRHDWPGNIRQLENAVYRAIVLSDRHQLRPYDFPAISGLSPPSEAPQASPPPPMAPGLVTAPAEDPVAEIAAHPVRILDEDGHMRALEAIEGDLIRLALERYQGHMSEVARRLGIGRSTLYRKVRENGLGDLAGLD